MTDRKVVLISGANTGIGKVTAMELARKGMTIVMAGRSEERNYQAIAEIKQATGNDRIHFLKLDLSSLASVKACSDEFHRQFNRLDILINNAGMFSTEEGKFERTQDNFEQLFQVNHLGHFLLTLLLLDVIEKSTPARIINVSSSAHMYGARSMGVNLNLATQQESHANFLTLYAHAKRCNLLCSNYLARQLQDKPIFVNCLHPGFINSEISRNLSKSKHLLSYLFRFLFKFFSSSPEQGAQTTLYVAQSSDIEEKKYTGRYFVPPGRLATPSSIALNETAQKKIWDFSIEACRAYLPNSYLQ
jgi:NAD(P)-dependent dehydrogenase (short-subunit alcohol dehydrogenase family)